LPSTSVPELVPRGTVMSFVLLAVFRLMPRRTAGSLGIIDLIVVVLIAGVAGHAMDEDDTLADGAVLVATQIGRSYIINWLTYAVPTTDRLASPHPEC
jgi:uncharacterized membrane protein YcaP (DUF421 family)